MNRCLVSVVVGVAVALHPVIAVSMEQPSCFVQVLRTVPASICGCISGDLGSASGQACTVPIDHPLFEYADAVEAVAGAAGFSDPVFDLPQVAVGHPCGPAINWSVVIQVAALTIACLAVCAVPAISTPGGFTICMACLYGQGLQSVVGCWMVTCSTDLDLPTPIFREVLVGAGGTSCIGRPVIPEPTGDGGD
jgi:hypothetical protein